MKKPEKLSNIIKNNNFIIAIVFIIAISFITIGFATYDKLLPISGNVIVKKYGILEITNITLVSSSNVQSSVTPSFDKNTASFNIVFGGTDSVYQAVYQIELTNNGSSNYIYSGFNYNPTITSANGTGVGTMNITTTGIENGDTIAPDEVKVFTITIDLTVTDPDTTYNASIDTDVASTNDTNGHLTASITPSTGNLQSPNTLATFTLDVINTYSINKDFTLSSSNSNFVVVDADGNDISSMTINANATNSYNFYLKKKDNAVFLSNLATTTILLKTNNNSINCGTLTLSVDVYVVPDTTIPTVGNAVFTINDTVGSATASWSRVDSGGTSITNYTVLLYNSSDTLVGTYNTNSDVNSYAFSSLSAGSYYFIVYGTDEAGNTGSASASSATTSNGYATKSSTVALQWVFNVTNSVTNMTFSGNSTANLHTSYSATVTASSNHTLPTSMTITMGGTTLTSGTDYTYSSSTGAIVINSVTGDISISGSATINICLVKGTKIMLADGTTKKIEDVNYDDLLLVYDYDNGTFTYEYPIWIEKGNKTNHYQLTTFSDGSTIKTAGFHGMFNYDLNRFVSVDNPKEFYVGASIAKLNKNKTGFTKVKIKSIKNVNKTVSYYHVVSTRYYNVIADSFLTTDGTVILSNLYGFDNNITWPSSRNIIMSNSDNLYKYSDLNGVPYYMFLGMRMEEAKVLNNYGLDKNTFLEYLKYNQLNSQMLKEPISKNGSRYWMVTTSDMVVNILNKSSYLVKEGSYYTLLAPKITTNFHGWYNTGDGKIYKPGAKVKIYYGTHFKALY